MNLIEKIQLLKRQIHSPDGADESFVTEVEIEADKRVARLISQVKKINHDLDGIKSYREQLKDRETILKKRKKNLLEFIKFILKELNRHGGGDAVHFATVVKGRPRVEITDKDAVPDQFVGRWERHISSTLIKDHVNAGGTLPPGAIIHDSEEHIRIRSNKRRR